MQLHFSHIFFGSFSLLASAQILFAQGSLTPSGDPGPTMKTLEEVEPRTAITSLPYTISTSGSYYLATDATVSTADSGITVSASNVTIDLNGYTLTGSTGSLTGIIASGTPSVIQIKNGIISGWEGDGINLSGATNCLIEKVTIDSCTGIGVQLPEGSTLQHCRITNNGGDGVETVGTHTFILQNQFSGNLRGIDLTNGNATVDGNQSSSNTGRGILVNSDENTVINNRTIGNATRGFEVRGSNNYISNNYTIRNGTSPDHNQVLDAAQTNNNEYNLLISDIPETLDRACKATLTNNVVNSVTDSNGITIDADNVTLDLGGFSLIGSGNTGGATGATPTSGTTIAEYVGVGVTSGQGIEVSGSQENITIRNGYIFAWGGHGIDGLSANYSTFENIHASFNDGNGIRGNVGCVITQCVAHGNKNNGIRGDENAVITNCTASQNGLNGIRADEGGTINNCTSYSNELDGFHINSGSTITDCSASYNAYHGFDLGSGTLCRSCNAYENGSSTSDGNIPTNPVTANAGFDLSSGGLLESCYASNNEGHGIHVTSNVRVTNCHAHENDFDGIRVSSTGCVIKNNSVTDNDSQGIRVASTGSLIISNKASGHVWEEFDIDTGNSYGPILDVTSDGDISGVAGADHPHANFSY